MPQLAAGISQDYFLATFGRLKRGVSREQAQAAIDLVYHRFETIPRSSTLKLADIRVVLQPGSQGFSLLRTTYEKPLRMLMVVVGLLLLIACANVANLLMARISGREKEIAVRLALGAGRRHLIRQILSESLLLTTTGAALGLMLSYWLDRVLLAVAPPMMGGSILLNVSPDWRVLVFTLLIAILVSVLSGIAAAIQATSPVMSPVLKGAPGQRVPSRISFRNALLVTQVALSLVLLIGAGLFLRSLRNLRSVDLGFDPRRLIVLTLEPGLNGYSQTAIQSLTDRLLQRVRSLPGVLAAIGLYGMMAFTVTARTREIGIRMALGADSARVLRQVIGESAVLTVMGIALGIPAALWASRAVESFLYELKATDPLTYGALAIVLAAVSLSAAWIPSGRAARVDPMVALRYE